MIVSKAGRVTFAEGLCHLCQQVGVVRLCAQEVAQGVGLRLCGCKHGCEHEGDEEGEEESFHSVLGFGGDG